jgi:hypothetical protein
MSNARLGGGSRRVLRISDFPAGVQGASFACTVRVSTALTLRISAAGVRHFYACVILSDVLFALMTLLSDLKQPLAANYVASHFDLKREGNVAVWYSSALLLLTSAAALAVGQVRYQDASEDRRRYVWWIASLFFVALSVDETARLHEKAGVLFTKYAGTIPWLTDGGRPAFAWMVVLLPLILLFMARMLLATRRFFGLHRRSRRLMLGGILCWVGVLGAEFVQAQLVRWSIDRSFQGVLEEGLEIVGASLFLFALIEFLRDEGTRPRVVAAAT